MSGNDLSQEVSKTIMLSYLNPAEEPGDGKGIDDSLIKPDKISEKLVVFREPRSAECEYFRFLKSRVTRYFNEDRGRDGGRVILVTGASRGSGKTVCALNLALAFARSFGSETLFLDADTRNRDCEKYLGLDGHPYPEGLSDVMSLHVRAGSVLINTGLAGMIYFPSGGFREDFADQLKGGEMEILLKNLRRRFRYIIVDAPPVFPMPETTILATFSDAVLMVMGAGTDGKQQLDHAMELLAGTNVIGVVLNRVKVAPGIRYGAYGYY